MSLNLHDNADIDLPAGERIMPESVKVVSCDKTGRLYGEIDPAE